jgi:prolyl oligopeptidase
VPAVMEPPPNSEIEAVTEILHDVAVTDPYRWLEDQESPRTREWISAQTRYARAYLDSIPHRERTRQRIRELLDVETYDLLQKAGNRYFFRKRLPGQDQPSIYMREGMDGADQILLDPSLRGTGPHTALRPLRISSDGRLLLYEVKQGGERMGTFELLDIEKLETLPDKLPRGYLRGFAFAPDSKAFYYVHETLETRESRAHAAYKHVLGTAFADDKEVFSAGDDKLQLHIVPGPDHLGFLVVRIDDELTTDFYLWQIESADKPELVIRDARYKFGPLLLTGGRVLAVTDHEAPNLRIVAIRPQNSLEPEFQDVIPCCETRIQNWMISGDTIFVSYLRDLRTEIRIFDLSGKSLGQLALDHCGTVRLVGVSDGGDEVFVEQESFTKPVQICRHRPRESAMRLFAERKVPFDPGGFRHIQVRFPSRDGTQIPMFLVGRPEALESGTHPTIMTSYGGYGIPATPQFSVFVAFLIEHGCVFALPNIRGGSEFGDGWHQAAKRHRRQVAFDDFIAAAEWLISNGRTASHKLAIFGGSNSGLLVGAAMTQRPDLFRAVVCMVPMLDMLRYHLFDGAHAWAGEFGTAENAEDFAVLRAYSPYHNVRDNTKYPATMMISGDADQNCNPLHARKMTARLQAASVSAYPILLDYSQYRGHSPVLPLSERVDALTDRTAFLCDQLQLVS